MKSNKFAFFMTDFGVAFCLLSRLPMPKLPESAFEDSPRSVWAYPVVGAVLGLFAGMTGALVLQLGLPASIAAGVIIGTLALLTGAMHEDGLGDTFDGFWGGRTRQDRLAIMKDSQIGTYGTLSLIVATTMRWIAYAALLQSGVGAIIAAAAVSRAAMSGVMYLLPHARKDGLSHSVGRPNLTTVLVAVGLAGLIACVFAGTAGLVGMAVAAMGVVLMSAIAKRKIGGQTGDVLGATQQVSEVFVLCTFLAILS